MTATGPCTSRREPRGSAQRNSVRRDLVLLLALLALTVEAGAQADGSVRWAFTTMPTSVEGSILSSPSAAPDGTLYFGVEVGGASSPAPSGRVFALRADGSEKWVFLAPDWVDSTPAVGPTGMVYFGTWNGVVFAIRPDGTKAWERAAGPFITSSPAIAPDGTLYVGVGADLVALTPEGNEKWRYTAGDWIDSAPAIGPDGGIYFGAWDAELYALNADGTLRWRFPTAGTIVSSPALAADGSVYIASRDGFLYALRRDGVLSWAFDTGDPAEASPVVSPNGIVYLPTSGGRIFALNPDGSERWRYPRRTDAALAGLYSTPALRSDDAIVFGTSDNAVIALRSDGTVLWKTSVGDWCDSSPLIASDGRIYLGCADKKLYSLAGSSEPLLSDWPQFHRDPARIGWQLLGAVAGTAGRITNLSVRSFAGVDQNTLIVGFVVHGTGRQSLLLRGVGPFLTAFGVTGVLPDPIVSVYEGSRLIQLNDNWSDAANAQAVDSAAQMVGAFSLPFGSRDAALLQDFSTGGYTVLIRDAAGRRGIALMEAYALASGAGDRLVNLSARGSVSPGDGVLIAGVVVTGTNRGLMVRGVGPALTGFGVSSALAQPSLRIFRGGQAVADNRAWGSASNATAIAAAAAQVGAFPLKAGSLDTALLVTLPPGAFTAQVGGLGGSSGVALIEIYEIP